ncbi:MULTISPECIES: copper resistance protein B [Caulobacter]|jgi:copper resistance protein B|uniref:copper resistance protein B n=1 Tax=Caulobacter TaxID=75 RepID=UPI00078560E0|nr:MULTISPECIES: copper resistance protein B [Caulobacter]ATC24401.1 copper resistance protein B [Caulobacter vibrioides]MCK5910084.1 copper resistance protein B [Caulobacter sp.]PIC00023.1 copper resistance protein B [Caulobacter sp. X]
MKVSVLALLPVLWAGPVLAQQGGHDMSTMGGMKMDDMKPAASAPVAKKKAPAKKAAPVAKKRAPAKKPAAKAADPHAGHDMSGMSGMSGMAPAAPAAKPADPHAGHDMSGMGDMKMDAAKPAAAPMAGHDMSTMGDMKMDGMAPADAKPGAAMAMPAGHDMSAMSGGQGGMEMGAPPVAEHETPPPPPPVDYLADKVFDPGAMVRARKVLAGEHGGAQVSQVMASILERQVRSGADGYRWEGEAWFGGDINRFVVKTEGEGDRKGVDAGEVQLLYSRAMAPYTDLQFGLRQDVEPKSRTYLTAGFQTLLPYWVEASGAVFLSNKGNLLARVEGAYDLRLTQRLLLQPRAELNFAAQNIPETETGSGLSTAELGLRLRYEIRREFAPYIGVSYERSVGKTADLARAAGRDVSDTSFVVGLRAWF